MKWYAVYTAPRSEKKISTRLEREGLEVYCPVFKELRQWSDRKKWVECPVLPSYTFVKINDSDFFKVRQLPGVVNFVYWLGKPAVIPDDEMHRLMIFVEYFPQVQVQKDSPFEVGDEVNINFGPLKGQEGIILNKSNNKARLQLKSLGLSLVANVNLDDLKFSNEKK